MRHLLALGFILIFSCGQVVWGDPAKLTVDVSHPGIKISPMLYGMMTEEINHSYDGGLYAELIQNRIFKDSPSSPSHWSVVKSGTANAEIALDEKDPVNNSALTRSLRLDVTSAGTRVGIANEGYWGIPVRPNTKYAASFYAKAGAGFSGALTVDIESNDGKNTSATASVPGITNDWKKYDVTLSTGDVSASVGNRFVISTTSPGTIWFNLVSLFPPTYHDRPNGNRIDLMQKMADMQTAFLRLPGGNYLEGNSIEERFNWQNTLGDLADRPGHQGPWGYRSTDGLGLSEFYGWCEDLKIQPLLAVFAGYALRGQHIQPGPALVPFVQEALDEIEYSVGDQKTSGGRRRVKDGHPDPYDIKYVEIGNEDWFDRSGSYDGRFAQFYDAIKGKYPQLQLIATTAVRSRTPDLIDDHFYRSARAMEADVHHYDKRSRSGPKIFVGEWATEEGTPTPDLNAALADAAWLTGLERNSDLVIMSCYAPLLVNVNPGARQWPTNLIGYNALDSFGSPSYYAQKMFNENRGDAVLPMQIDQQAAPADLAPMPHGAIGVGSWQTVSEFKDIKVTDGDKILYQTDFSKGSTDWRARGGTWKVEDGAYRQSSDLPDCRTTTGDTSWTDYTYTLKARKISGAEGFLILFHSEGRNSYFSWNVGGWGNSRTALERAEDGAKHELGESEPFTVETGKWYDIRIEVKGHDIKCYLDDKLITKATESTTLPDALIATASRVDSTGEVILKVINTLPIPEAAQIELQGATDVAKHAQVELLTGKPKDVNTIEAPEKVYPKQMKIDDAGATFSHEFPPSSLTIMRLQAK